MHDKFPLKYKNKIDIILMNFKRNQKQFSYLIKQMMKIKSKEEWLGY
ncbi:hypothetical protein AM305_03633 [Actinobacillus minor NM305]|uniref:Uncharacterized protein n=1 Tax=Actinobacillus minor NM305 TaxID=637911 RepID=C5S535_9PAST|nr:hypothetical protein AM305_03633 [Actinobacillus minor NM305]